MRDNPPAVAGAVLMWEDALTKHRRLGFMGPIWVLAVALVGTTTGLSSTRAQNSTPRPFIGFDAGPQLAQGNVPNIERPITFTAAQADRGKRRYLSRCVDCHGEDLKGGINGGVPLRGQQFEMKFGNGAPASALFLFMSTLMPPGDPGRFSAATYADLMAYVLKRNGYRAGAPLPSDVDSLDNLIIEK